MKIKHFMQEKSGSALLWSLFLILIFCTLSVVIYSAVIVYANYQAAEAELQRAATISADISMENANVRDLVLDVPAISASESFYANLIEAGWVKEDNVWVRYDGDEKLYSLADMQVEITDMTIRIDTTFEIPLLWEIGDMSNVRIPMRIQASILYVDEN
jgi:hypothetical protein